ncbi:MAG: hypothetical protein HYX73_00520 [Acidobacteria bacterium]|nr:hypothetical protein [Acidobacteriota bacterium]
MKGPALQTGARLLPSCSPFPLRKITSWRRSMNASLSPNFDARQPTEGDSLEKSKMSSETKFQIMGWLLVLVLVLAGGAGFYSWSLNQQTQELKSSMQTQISSQDEMIQQMQDQLGVHDQDFTAIQSDMSATKADLSTAQGELSSTQRMVDQLANQQKEAAEQLTGQLDELQQDQENTKGSVGNLSTDVSGVKQEVSVTKQDIASTRSDLQRAVGDLGVQSGLIARNREELAELKLRGERDYYEFDLRKALQPQKYGAGIALQLKKTDVKRQKYTVNLLADDRTIEKKDKNTNEPVQFYQQGYRMPSEIVVNQIYKDRIVGYISVPKQRAQTQMSSLGSGQMAP